MNEWTTALWRELVFVHRCGQRCHRTSRPLANVGGGGTWRNGLPAKIADKRITAADHRLRWLCRGNYEIGRKTTSLLRCAELCTQKGAFRFEFTLTWRHGKFVLIDVIYWRMLFFHVMALARLTNITNWVTHLKIEIFSFVTSSDTVFWRAVDKNWLFPLFYCVIWHVLQAEN
jgi:hypothetical protein